jgi:hypothetical protein
VISKPPLPSTARKYPIGGPGKPVLEWEEVTLDYMLQMFRERADRRMAEQLKKANRLN